MITHRLTALALSAVLLTACGGGSEDSETPSDTAAAPTAEQSATAAEDGATSSEAAPTGAAIVDKLKAAGLPVTLTMDFDETNDPNNQLGRPGGYVDKVAFSDSRIDPAAYTPNSVEVGGSVEVYGDQAGAQERADYIKSVTAGNAALTEYGIVNGPVLLRLSRELTPAQVAEYEAALQS